VESYAEQDRVLAIIKIQAGTGCTDDDKLEAKRQDSGGMQIH